MSERLPGQGPAITAMNAIGLWYGDRPIHAGLATAAAVVGLGVTAVITLENVVRVDLWLPGKPTKYFDEARALEGPVLFERRLPDEYPRALVVTRQGETGRLAIAAAAKQ